MPITTTQSFFETAFFLELLRVTIFVILTLYAIFALLIVRQVSLMSKTLVTQVSPLVKAISIVHAGFAIGLAVFILGVL